jgi:hypothetical protein
MIISTRLLQVVNSLFQTCWQLGTSSANTTWWRLVGRLATRYEILRVLLQIWKQVVTRLLSSRYQDVFALLVPSCCDKSGTSCYHLVTRLMTVTDLLQVVPTRLIKAVCNKLLRACCHQLVNNLLRADDIRLVETTCCESVGLINLVTRW